MCIDWFEWAEAPDEGQELVKPVSSRLKDVMETETFMPMHSRKDNTDSVFVAGAPCSFVGSQSGWLLD